MGAEGGGGLRDTLLLGGGGGKHPYLSPGWRQARGAWGFAATSPGGKGLRRQQQAAPPWAAGAEALLRFSWPEPTKSWPPRSRASGQGGPVARGGGLQLGAAGGS